MKQIYIAYINDTFESQQLEVIAFTTIGFIDYRSEIPKKKLNKEAINNRKQYAIKYYRQKHKMYPTGVFKPTIVFDEVGFKQVVAKMRMLRMLL